MKKQDGIEHLNDSDVLPFSAAPKAFVLQNPQLSTCYRAANRSLRSRKDWI